MSPRTTSRITVVLGGLSLLAVLGMALALQDISHHEPDLTLEWRVVRVAFLVILAFHASAVIAAWKAAGFPTRSG